MQMKLCSRCKKRVAVIYVTKTENGQTTSEGLCLRCAKELGIKPMSDIIRKLGISEEEFDAMADEVAGMIPFVEPDDELQERITSLIYDDVKGTGDLNLQRYESVLQAMLDPAGTCRCDTLMLGCTELSVLNEAFPLPQLPIIDAQAVLVEDTVSRAKAIRR